MRMIIQLFLGFGLIETRLSKFGPFLVINYIENSYQNMSLIKAGLPLLYASMKKQSERFGQSLTQKNDFENIWHSIPNRAKYLEHFYGCFHRPLALLTNH